MSHARRLRFKTGARRLLLALLVVSATVAVFWLRGVRRQAAPGPAPQAHLSATDAEMVTRDFRHVETRMDRTVWILEAKRAEVQDDKARLNKVRITWYGEPGTVPVVITSANGRIDFAKRHAVLNGNVRLERADGAVLETERLSWDEGRKLLEAPLPVVIRTPTFTFRGTSLVANLDRQWVRLNGLVQGEIRDAAATVARPS